MNRRRYLSFLILLLTIPVLIFGCGSKEPVRYLASEVSLITPQKTTKQEVLTYMGEPNEKSVDMDRGEVWTYYQVNKDLIRKTPYIGDRFGHEEYDVVTITFQGEMVNTCVYRMLKQGEFTQPVREQ